MLRMPPAPRCTRLLHVGVLATLLGGHAFAAAPAQAAAGAQTQAAAGTATAIEHKPERRPVVQQLRDRHAAARAARGLPLPQARDDQPVVPHPPRAIAAPLAPPRRGRAPGLASYEAAAQQTAHAWAAGYNRYGQLGTTSNARCAGQLSCSSGSLEVGGLAGVAGVAAGEEAGIA